LQGGGTLAGSDGKRTHDLWMMSPSPRPQGQTAPQFIITLQLKPAPVVASGPYYINSVSDNNGIKSNSKVNDVPQVRLHVRSCQAAKRRRVKKRTNKTKHLKVEQENIVSKLEGNLKNAEIALQKEREAKKVYRTKFHGLQLDQARKLEKNSIISNLSLVKSIQRNKNCADFLLTKLNKPVVRLSDKVVEPLFVNGQKVVLGEGTFGCVEVCRLRTVGIEVAIKKLNNPDKAVTSGSACILEARVMMANPLFPLVFGLSDHGIVMELITVNVHETLTVHKILQSAQDTWIRNHEWKGLCLSLLEGLEFMHLKTGILHNDLKADNIMMKLAPYLSGLIPKIVDFGKATHVSCPVVYRLSASQQLKYNRYHRHLAYELRNVQGSCQSFATDI
jgi:hypothetical protein